MSSGFYYTQGYKTSPTFDCEETLRYFAPDNATLFYRDCFGNVMTVEEGVIYEQSISTI
ncbi:MAG: hypothetical protein V4721_00560 [Bacteroidota bacterium]